LIDLHTHTTASDGACTPDELVSRAAAAGVSVLAVTDHDTFGGCAAASAACARHKIEFVTGIEVTALDRDRDVHVLGYFLDIESESFNEFLAIQRLRRLERVRQMIERLREHGIALDADAVLAPGLADSHKSAGRPWIARALVAAGHVPNMAEAFNRWLAPGRPAFVRRSAAAPPEVFARIHAAGGLASLAHPGLLQQDDWIPGYVKAGLDALEAYHRDHGAEATARYLALAATHGVAITGGSDYHADRAYGGGGPGKVSLPTDLYQRLLGTCAARRATASGPSTSS
jgi:predicted metal-dependent phosphoesterase TrpH